jgi:hypothetical protein
VQKRMKKAPLVLVSELRFVSQLSQVLMVGGGRGRFADSSCREDIMLVRARAHACAFKCR